MTSCRKIVQLVAGIIRPSFYEELKPNSFMQRIKNNIFLHTETTSRNLEEI
jgi:hypothetical protein